MTNNAMALALETQPFVEIDALMNITGIQSITNFWEIDVFKKST